MKTNINRDLIPNEMYEGEVNNIIDINKKYKTRCGYDVKIHTTNGLDKTYPVIAEFVDVTGRVLIHRYNEKGLFAIDDYRHEYDLIEVKEIPKLQGYLNVYILPGGIKGSYSNELFRTSDIIIDLSTLTEKNFV